MNKITCKELSNKGLVSKKYEHFSSISINMFPISKLWTFDIPATYSGDGSTGPWRHLRPKSIYDKAILME